MYKKKTKAIGKRICPCISSEHGNEELEISSDDILADGLLKKGKELNQLEVAIGDGMEFTIHGDLKNKGKKNKQLMNNSKVSSNKKKFANLLILIINFLSITDDGKFNQSSR